MPIYIFFIDRIQEVINRTTRKLKNLSDKEWECLISDFLIFQGLQKRKFSGDFRGDRS